MERACRPMCVLRRAARACLVLTLAVATGAVACGPTAEQPAPPAPPAPDRPEIGNPAPTTDASPRAATLPAPPPAVLALQKALAAPPAGVRLDADGRLVCDQDGAEMVLVPETDFTMGSDDGGLDERPPHVVSVSQFLIDRHEVTNAQFARFVADTGYVTDAEKGDGGYALYGDAWARGSDWRRPLGPDSSLEGRESHPVVLVSWNDAQAYASWAGRRLPTEAEFERCLRGGIDGATYPWGEQTSPPPLFGNYVDEAFRAAHPGAKLAGWAIEDYDDGFARTSPVGRFTQSPLGLFDVSGNVWEWCSDGYDPEYYAVAPRRDPTGAAAESHRVSRGGGWNSWPDKLRNSFRKATSQDYSWDVLGFRCAMSVR